MLKKGDLGTGNFQEFYIFMRDIYMILTGTPILQTQLFIKIKDGIIVLKMKKMRKMFSKTCLL